MATIENVPSIAALTAVAHLVGNSANAATPHLPFYPQNLLPANWYLNLPNFHADRIDAEKSGEQPLDLSSKSSGNNNNNNNNGTSISESKIAPTMRLPALDSKHIFK